ncbi:hypothetical protein G9C85_08050 [Halorubellus sp. JP-L1]|uniref:hypothetical protein n=1 Tax=Halorubellus sp. JP-L1 TaxID=2715753 RepID=UPI00140827F8|nr:hypothetical protein [Halorubellus sp. JP-L1]NHN41588.1 hypothetical protein [Halorubellus sp. JP-L1]
MDDRAGSEGTDSLGIRFWLEEVSLTQSEREQVTSIAFDDLSSDQREIVRTVFEEGEYTTAHESASPALEALRDRIEQRTGNGETLEAYLRRKDTYYRVGFADGDHIIAHPDH